MVSSGRLSFTGSFQPNWPRVCCRNADGDSILTERKRRLKLATLLKPTSKQIVAMFSSVCISQLTSA